MDIITIGEITIDDIVLTDGTVEKNVLGGGSVYSAVGAKIWQRQVGIHSVTGDLYVEEIASQMRDAEIDIQGIQSVPGHGIELWLLHESENEKQQLPKLASKSFEELDIQRGPLPKPYQAAPAYHLAPQSVEGHFRGLQEIHKNHPNALISMDILADKFIAAHKYQDKALLSQLTAFLPSREEVKMIWGTDNMVQWLQEMSQLNIPYLAVKLGGEGSLIYDPKTKKVLHIPVFSVNVVDTTGAGDSFCGGFLAGIQLGKEVIEAAAMGTVAASFVIECYGALNAEMTNNTERDARLQTVLEGVCPV